MRIQCHQEFYSGYCADIRRFACHIGQKPDNTFGDNHRLNWRRILTLESLGSLSNRSKALLWPRSTNAAIWRTDIVSRYNCLKALFEHTLGEEVEQESIIRIWRGTSESPLFVICPGEG